MFVLVSWFRLYRVVFLAMLPCKNFFPQIGQGATQWRLQQGVLRDEKFLLKTDEPWVKRNPPVARVACCSRSCALARRPDGVVGHAAPVSAPVPSSPSAQCTFCVALVTPPFCSRKGQEPRGRQINQDPDFVSLFSLPGFHLMLIFVLFFKTSLCCKQQTRSPLGLRKRQKHTWRFLRRC